MRKGAKYFIAFCGISLLIFYLTSCSRETFISESNSDTPPAPPEGLRVFAAHDGAIGIEWNGSQVNSILRYNIFRSKFPNYNFKKVGFTNETHYIDSPLSYDTTYYYYITATGTNNYESNNSITVNAKPVNAYPPKNIYDISVYGKNTGSSKFIKLYWTPQEEYDLKEYRIYRSLFPDFSISPDKLIGTTGFPFFDDYGVSLLQTYYYKIIAVDKGNLESDYSPVVSDLVLESPILIYPADNSAVKNLNKLQFQSSYPAGIYKIIIQSNELYGTIAEYNLTSSEINRPITQIIDPAILTSFKKYYWRVISYTQSFSEPNSYSPLFSFTYIAE